MKKRKHPVLTSPWKIGFLVSLFLVLAGVGENLVLTRAFNLPWSWLSFNQGKWAFRMDSFSNQMFPQIAIVFLLSMIAYFTVTSAVRKYRAYLDSGLDYKDLVKSINSISSLEDEERIKRLDKHPELRDFLNDVKSQVKEREEDLAKREMEVEEKLMNDDASTQIESDCSVLTDAINKSASENTEFDGDLDLSHPAVIRVAEAVNKISARAWRSWGEEARARMSLLHEDLMEAGDFLKSKLASISEELLSASDDAKKIEGQVAELKNRVEGKTIDIDFKGELETLAIISDHLSVMSKLSDSLTDLGEETKSIAISTALQAGSGEGTLADLIQLAEGVKEVAEKYEQSAKSFESLTNEISKSVVSLQTQFRKVDPRSDTDTASTVATISGKMSLWVERIMILSDKIRAIEETYNLSFKTLEEKVSGYADLKEKKVQDEEKLQDDAVEDVSLELEKSEGISTGPAADNKTSAEKKRGAKKSKLGSDLLSSGFEPEDHTGSEMGLADDLDTAEGFSMESVSSQAEDGWDGGSDYGFPGIEKENEELFEHDRPPEDTSIPADFSKDEDPKKSRVPDDGAENDATPGENDGDEDSDDKLEAVSFKSLGSKEDIPKQKTPKEKTGQPGDLVHGEQMESEGVIDLYELGAVDYAASGSD